MDGALSQSEHTDGQLMSTAHARGWFAPRRFKADINQRSQWLRLADRPSARRTSKCPVNLIYGSFVEDLQAFSRQSMTNSEYSSVRQAVPIKQGVAIIPWIPEVTGASMTLKKTDSTPD